MTARDSGVLRRAASLRAHLGLPYGSSMVDEVGSDCEL